MLCKSRKKRQRYLEKILLRTIFLLSLFFHAWEPNSRNTPTAVSRGIFVFSSSAILVSLLLCRPSALSISAPRSASVENLHSVLPAFSPHSLQGTEQRVEKNINSTDRKRDLPLRFRAFLTGYTRMIFRVAPGFLDFPPFLVRRRIAKML